MSCLNPSNFIKLPKSLSCQLPQSSTSPTPPSITIPTSSHSMVGPMSSVVSCNDTKTVSSGAQAVFHPPVSTCTFCRGAPGSLIKHASSTRGASSSTVPGGFSTPKGKANKKLSVLQGNDHCRGVKSNQVGKSWKITVPFRHDKIPEHENGTFNKIYIYIYSHPEVDRILKIFKKDF